MARGAGGRAGSDGPGSSRRRTCGEPPLAPEHSRPGFPGDTTRRWRLGSPISRHARGHKTGHNTLREHAQHAPHPGVAACGIRPRRLSSALPAATVAVLARSFARTAGRRFLARHSTSPAALLARRSARSPLCAHPALLALRAPPLCSHRHVPAPPGSSTASCSHDRCSPRRLAWRRSVTSQRAPHATHAATPSSKAFERAFSGAEIARDAWVSGMTRRNI